MPRHRPTAALKARVEELAGLGLPPDTIAREVGLALKALTAVYVDQLRDGPLKARAKVRSDLARLSEGDGVAAAHAARALANLRDDDGVDDDPLVDAEAEPVRVYIPCNARDCEYGRRHGRHCPECEAASAASRARYEPSRPAAAALPAPSGETASSTRDSAVR